MHKKRNNIILILSVLMTACVGSSQSQSANFGASVVGNESSNGRKANLSSQLGVDLNNCFNDENPPSSTMIMEGGSTFKYFTPGAAFCSKDLRLRLEPTGDLVLYDRTNETSTSLGTRLWGLFESENVSEGDKLELQKLAQSDYLQVSIGRDSESIPHLVLKSTDPGESFTYQMKNEQAKYSVSKNTPYLNLGPQSNASNISNNRLSLVWGSNILLSRPIDVNPPSPRILCLNTNPESDVMSWRANEPGFKSFKTGTALCTKTVALVFQKDGNLVLYKYSDANYFLDDLNLHSGKALWALWDKNMENEWTQTEKTDLQNALASDPSVHLEITDNDNIPHLAFVGADPELGGKAFFANWINFRTTNSTGSNLTISSTDSNFTLSGDKLSLLVSSPVNPCGRG